MPLCLRKTERKGKGGSSSNESEKDNKSRMMSGSKDLRGVSARKRNNEKATNNDVTFTVLQKNEELKNWFASSKATDGMRYYCVKRGGMTKKKYGRHIINTFSWVQENTTTNTALASY